MRTSPSNTTSSQMPMVSKYRNGIAPDPNTFFVQCIGNHSGRPLKGPIANCFSISCQDQQHCQQLFVLCKAIWMSKAFYPRIRGTVIPFITCGDFKQVLHAHLDLLTDQERTTKLFKTIELIEQLEHIRQQQLKELNLAKTVLLRKILG